MNIKILVTILGLLFAPLTFAQVFANPSFQDLGTVSTPESVETTVTFMNQSPRPLEGVSANCSGSFSTFECSSTCFTVPAFGSCEVMVTFHPAENDGLRQTLDISFFGGGSFATATVYGTDAAPTEVSPAATFINE
jgi:hypothetical protein